MTPVDIVVIVLCAVVVTAVAGGMVWRKIKGKPSGCADCAHCASAPRPAVGDSQKGREEEASSSHTCNGCCHGCTACAHSLPGKQNEKEKKSDIGR